MIETHDLAKCFDIFWAVNGINLLVSSGQALGLLGPNGAGKTTTVRLLTSVLAPSRGSATVAGFDVVRQPEQVRASVGVLTEQHGLYDRMPAGAYLDFFGQLYGLDANFRKARIQNLLEMFGLGAESRRRIGEFSKGMRQKLALARALLHEPPVLLLDEPTSAMDPESAHVVRDAIRELKSASRAIIICTHNLAEAEALSDQIAIIRRGSIIARGSPQELKLALLGPAEYELRFDQPLDGRFPDLPSNTCLTTHGGDWLRYRTSEPNTDNPLILRALMEQDYAVVSLQEVPRSLEQVYLQAVQAPAGGERING
jgi:ABC-2 type transport system ATP-binding protein